MTARAYRCDYCPDDVHQPDRARQPRPVQAPAAPQPGTQVPAHPSTGETRPRVAETRHRRMARPTMTAEPLTVTELDAETIEELQPPCDSVERSAFTLAVIATCAEPAAWIVAYRKDCGHEIQGLRCSRCKDRLLNRAASGDINCTICRAARLQATVSRVEPLR